MGCQAALHAVQHGGQFAKIHRLDQIGIGALLQPEQSIIKRASGRQDDNPQLGRLRAQSAGDAEAVFIRQAKIQDQQIRRMLRDLLIDVVAIAFKHDLKAGPPQVKNQLPSIVEVVLDDPQACHFGALAVRWMGSQTMKQAPRFRPVSARTQPPWRSTI
ncbi:hypothetical protein Thiowin_00456 [Thiorhodovibrio winogradskyi]|uniref:Uncharacterized protein n=1 Tax=Thiorhodovibrio winogradskyi TaxID=77007 RepID=A0ABZ0S4U2_9GAMM